MKKMKICVLLCCCLFAIGLCQANDRIETAKAQTYQAIDLHPLRDGMSHWRKRYGRDRNDPMYDPSQIVHIAENMLAYQNADGGWPNNVDWQAQIDPDTVRAIKGERRMVSTFDNHNTFSQIDYLAKVYIATNLARYRNAVERGLDYIFREQHPTGGWRGWDVDAITYNDGVMIGIMTLLKDIADRKPQFAWISDELHTKARAALHRAIAVTLKCQIVVKGKKTGWCQQHDHTTYKPVKARTYELPSITAGQTAKIVHFLMRIENPSPEIIDAIESAVQWFHNAKIEGIRLKRIEISPTRFRNHTATTDLIVVKDPDAPPLWARFHEIGTNRPFMANRDGNKVYSLSQVALERRTGYAWYGYWPARILEKDYPIWKNKNRRQK